VLRDLESQKRTHSKSEGATVSKDSVPSKKAAIKKERDVEDSEGSGPPEDLLHKTRASVYDKDSEGAQVVRKMILGLEELLTQQDIDSSPVFTLRKASEAGGEAPSIIGEHWIPHLRETGHLADCPPPQGLCCRGRMATSVHEERHCQTHLWHGVPPEEGQRQSSNRSNTPNGGFPL
ncbi:MAG: hypothetical protein MPJ22_12645, partial [Pirellulales bacterium]|nr:hypothetical protein [Pirellulales bacterium]